MKPPNTILIVDNELHVRKSTRLRLETKGYRVFTADTPAAAREILEQVRIYLAIVDVRLRDDNDPNDVTGLDFAGELGPETARIILTGFPTTEIARRALADHLNQVAPAQDIIAKQEGPRRLLETVERVLRERVLSNINFSLEIEFDDGITLQTLMTPLRKTPETTEVEEDEVEELMRRLFQKESGIKLYYTPAGRGGASVALVKPIYNGMEGAPLVVKFGPANHMDKEISAYRNHVEPFVHRHSTVLIGSPVRTHHLAGCKLLFVGHSTDKPQDFNSFHKDGRFSKEQLQQTIHKIFFQSCGIWYRGKRGWQDSDGSLPRVMQRQLGLNPLSQESEIQVDLNTILDSDAFHHVSFDRISAGSIRVQIDGDEEKLPDPVFLLSNRAQVLPTPTFCAITHGDLNGRNLLIDDDGSSWLIDFYRTGWGPALRDAAELESAIKFELIHNTNLPALLAFEQTMISPKSLLSELTLPDRASGEGFQRALAAIQAIRKAAYEIAETEYVNEYYAMLLFYALKMMTWKGVSSIDERRRPFRQRHALYSAALLSAKFVSPDKHEEPETHIV